MYGRDPRQIAESELDPGERLLWSGKPSRASMIREFVDPAADILLVVIFVAMAMLAYFISRSVNPSSTTWISVLFLPTGVLLGRRISAIREAAMTAYAVTDRRIIIVRTRHGRIVRSYRPTDVHGPERTERPDGTGTITFTFATNPQSFVDSPADRWISDAKPRLIGVSDVRSVEQLIRNTFLTPKCVE